MNRRDRRLAGTVQYLPVDEIEKSTVQPRKTFDETAIRELAASIAACGILNPLTVRRKGTAYELVAGERRLRAAKLAGLAEVPCIILNADMETASLMALVENIQREDLDFIEEAQGIRCLLDRFDMSQEQAARLLGKSQSSVANKLRLLRHCPAVLEALREAGLTERHARALLRLPDEASTLAAIQEIVRQGMSVARTERYIESLLSTTTAKKRSASVGAFLNNLTQNLQKIQLSGIPAVSERRETDSQIVLTITIPK